MSLPRLIFRPYIRARPILSQYRCFHNSRFAGRGIKILFCGSDDFSLKSLQALHDLKKETDEEHIESIDVIVKHEKPRGRGLKEHRPNPVKQYAEENSLKVLAMPEEQFEGLELPEYVDLIVAVSFGLFIPKNVLGHARFGGVNVHPSFLPKYWGASPIQHALLNGDESTGVVVQTLHPEKFDAGKILAKSEPVPINIDLYKFHPLPSSPGSPYRELESELGEIGAQLLADVIRKKHYDHVVQEDLPPVETSEKRRHAPFLVTEASRIKFNEMRALDVFRGGLVYDHMFCYRERLAKGEKGEKGEKHSLGKSMRTVMGPFRLPTHPEFKKYLEKEDPEVQIAFVPDPEDESDQKKGKKTKRLGCLALRVSPQDWVCFKNYTIEGRGQKDASNWTSLTKKTHRFTSYSTSELED